jgi:RNA polymerase sigma factor (sigma-70 family)
MASTNLQEYVANRDPEAFRRLVHDYQDMVYGTCRRILGHRAEVDDAVQETFIRLARKAGEIRADNPGGWLHACARTTALNVLQARKNRGEKERPLTISEPRAEIAAGTDASERNENASIVDACLDELSESDRDVVVSYFFIEKSQQEIAGRMGVSQQTIQKRIDRVLQTLRRKFIVRGLAVPGLMTAFLYDLHAESKVPLELARHLENIDPVALATRQSSFLAAQSASAAVGSSAGKIAVIAAVVALAAWGALQLPGRQQVAETPYHARWDFTSGTPDGIEIMAGSEESPSKKAVALPANLPAEMMMATVRMHADQGQNNSAFYFGWLDAADAPAATTARSKTGLRFASGEINSYRYYITREFIVAAENDEFLAVYAYSDPSASIRLFFRYDNIVLDSIELEEIQRDKIPVQLRNPRQILADIQRSSVQ